MTIGLFALAIVAGCLFALGFWLLGGTVIAARTWLRTRKTHRP